MTLPNRYYVYTLLDGDGDILYVGRTSNVAARLRSHHRECQQRLRAGDSHKAGWFYRTRDLAISGPYTADVSLRTERRRIEHLQPIGNIRHTSREVFWGWRR